MISSPQHTVQRSDGRKSSGLWKADDLSSDSQWLSLHALWLEVNEALLPEQIGGNVV